MEPVRFPPSIPAAARAERVKPAESRKDAGREHAFRRFLKGGGDEGKDEGEGPGGGAKPPPEAAPEEKAAAAAAGDAEEPTRGRRIDIRI